MNAALEKLFTGRPVLCDGAMGTMLYSCGVFINRCYDELNVTQPDMVRSVHEQYLLAGAEVIAERIRQTICQKPIFAEGCSIEVSVSVGLASHGDESEATPEILLKKADLALYRAKASGRNRVEVS